MILFQIRDTDGGVNHAAAAAGPFLFDARKERAVALSEEGLDACCLSGRFHAAIRAMRFVPAIPA